MQPSSAWDRITECGPLFFKYPLYELCLTHYCRHSGITQSIVNTVGNCAGFASPQIGTFLLKGSKSNLQSWNPVFYVAAIVAAFGGLLSFNLHSILSETNYITILYNLIWYKLYSRGALTGNYTLFKLYTFQLVQLRHLECSCLLTKKENLLNWNLHQGLVFLIFGSGEAQNWNQNSSEKKSDRKCRRDEDFLISDRSSSSSGLNSES